MIGLGSSLKGTDVLKFSTEQCAFARDGTLERSSPHVQMLANDVIEDCGRVGL